MLHDMIDKWQVECVFGEIENHFKDPLRPSNSQLVAFEIYGDNSFWNERLNI